MESLCAALEAMLLWIGALTVGALALLGLVVVLNALEAAAR